MRLVRDRQILAVCSWINDNYLPWYEDDRHDSA
jgi:hypothetical protein